MFYLIGKSLKHSKSEYIHNSLSNLNYKLKEIEDLEEFFVKKDFLGINVTIPYKEECMKYLDVISDRAKEIGSVNTVVNRDGILYGFNTDYDGFMALLEKNNIDVFNKRVLILGTGGSSKTVNKVMKDLKAKSITFCSRSKTEHLNYNEVHNFDFEIVVNTTPVGMYPNNDKLILDLNFNSLEAVIDLIYNPLTTKLLASTNVKTVNGLYMLVYQAYKAHQYFINKDIDESIVLNIYKDLLYKSLNIVLIGMPMSGKTTIGKKLSKKFNKQFVDIDFEIEKEQNKTIPEIFELGEGVFRSIESRITYKYSTLNNLVISTGGGVIKNSNNIENLRQNGIIVFIDRPLEELLKEESGDRPLIKNKQSIIDLYNERIDLYKKNSDILIKDDLDLEVLYETINSKWG